MKHLGLIIALAWPGMAAADNVIAAQEMLAIPDIPVTNDRGEQAGLRNMLPDTAPVIISFTYTNCDSMCDVTNAILLDVDERLDEGGQSATRIATISIDPQNDTPDRLADTRAELQASDRWLMLTAGLRGTRPLLEALRFPAGPIETHQLMFLVGRPCSGRVHRIVAFADPERLVALAEALPECAS